jgi:hypothetical protein
MEIKNINIIIKKNKIPRKNAAKLLKELYTGIYIILIKKEIRDNTN